MKAFSFCLLISILVASCAARKPFFRQRPGNKKATVACTQPAQSICFFDKKYRTDQYHKHIDAQKMISGYWCPLSDQFPVCNISHGNAVVYHNNSGVYIFYRPDAKNHSVMVLSNGKDKPFIVSDPERYKSALLNYLQLKLPGNFVTKTEAGHDNFIYGAKHSS